MQNKIKHCLLTLVLNISIATVFADESILSPSVNQSKLSPSVIMPASVASKPNAVVPVASSVNGSSLTGTLSESQENALSPYIVEIPVQDDSDILRKKVFTEALNLVLARVSNNSKVATLPAIKEAFSNSELYVRQFNYVNKSTASDKQTLFLQITFEPKAISQLLQRSSKAMWVKKKPATLLWIAKEKVRGDFLMDENEREELISLTNRQSQTTGAPIMLPLWDLQDIKSVQAYDICCFNIKAIKSASSRYNAASIAIGCLKPSILGGNVWASTWQLLQGDKIQQFSFTGPTIENVITQALKNVGGNVADTAMPITGQTTRVVLRVVDVNGLDQYNEVVKYLYAVSKIVTHIDLININATDIELAVNVIGGQEALSDVLKTQGRLISNSDVVEPPPGIDLNYKWVTLDNEKSKAISVQPLS